MSIIKITPKIYRAHCKYLDCRAFDYKQKAWVIKPTLLAKH